MTTGVLAPDAILRFCDNRGNPLVGGQVLTQVGGVNTATYSDVGLTTALPNPIILNSRGEVATSAGASAQCFLTPNTVYTFTVSDANGNQIWVATYVNGVQITLTQQLVGQTLWPRTLAEISAGVTPVNYFYRPGIIDRYGTNSVPGTTDMSGALQGAVSCNSEVYALSGFIYYCGTTTINISSPLVLSLYGAKLQTAVNGTTFLNATAALSIMGGEIYGRGNSVYTAQETLISWSGANSAAYVSGLLIKDCTIHSVGAYGVYSLFGQEAAIENCYFYDIGYAAVLALSAVDWRIASGTVDTVSPGTSGNAYGISFSRLTTDTTTVYPFSTNCTVIGVTVQNIPLWAALDTHGGQNCQFIGNTVINCKYGVAIGSSLNTGGVYTYAPQNCKSIGNTITSAAGGNGINITGAGTVLGTPIQNASGCASIGDTLIGGGLAGASTNGAFVAFYTEGMQIVGLTSVDALVNGICLYHDNYDFTISGGSITDPHDPSQICNCVCMDADYNTGVISGISTLKVNAALDTHVADRGITITVATNSSLVLGATRNTCPTHYAGITSNVLTTLTDSSGGTASSTIALVPGSYTQSEIANAFASFAASLNSIIALLKANGIGQ